jgi:hypothetical protein
MRVGGAKDGERLRACALDAWAWSPGLGGYFSIAVSYMRGPVSQSVSLSPYAAKA